jgi:hypothetical protein
LIKWRNSVKWPMRLKRNNSTWTKISLSYIWLKLICHEVVHWGKDHVKNYCFLLPSPKTYRYNLCKVLLCKTANSLLEERQNFFITSLIRKGQPVQRPKWRLKRKKVHWKVETLPRSSQW